MGVSFKKVSSPSVIVRDRIMTISIHRPYRRAHDYKNWRGDKKSLQIVEIFIVRRSVILLVQKIQKDNNSRKRKKIQQNFLNKKSFYFTGNLKTVLN